MAVGQPGGAGSGALGAIADLVRARADIVDVVSEFVALQPAGKSYKGLCPFHAEKTPSFTVSPDRQLFYCFGCGAGGNVFTFLMKLQGLSFVEALRRVAERVGMGADVERALRGGRAQGRPAAVERLLEIQAQACAWFVEQLWQSREGEAARRYLEQRGVDAGMAKAFRLGYAPAEWHALERALGRDARALEALREAGLVVVREDGRHYDRFRERLMFPIADARGQVVGFGGRALAAGQEPKYLNSPESPVYQKSQILYGLDRAAAAIRRSGRAVVVEGYMDVLAMHQFGLTEAVATCGTALTASHGRALVRLARQVVVAFDSDAAGQSGALRGLAQLRAAGLDVRVAVLPPPHDPDSLLRSEGRSAMDAVLEEARGVYEFSVEQALRGANLETPAGKAAAVANVLPILLEVPGAVEQEALVAQVARRLHVSERALRREMEQALRRKRAGARGGPGGGAHDRKPVLYNSKGPHVQGRAGGESGTPDKGPVVERELLRLLVEMPELVERIRGRLTSSDFATPSYGALFDALMAEGESALSDPALAQVASSVVGSSEVSVRADALDAYVKGLHRAARERELAAIEVKIEEAARSGGAPDERLVRLAELAVLYREVWERLRSERVLS